MFNVIMMSCMGEIVMIKINFDDDDQNVEISKFQIAALLVEREQSIMRARKMAETSAKLREIIKAQY